MLCFIFTLSFKISKNLFSVRTPKNEQQYSRKWVFPIPFSKKHHWVYAHILTSFQTKSSLLLPLSRNKLSLSTWFSIFCPSRCGCRLIFFGNCSCKISSADSTFTLAYQDSTGSLFENASSQFRNFYNNATFWLLFKVLLINRVLFQTWNTILSSLFTLFFIVTTDTFLLCWNYVGKSNIYSGID